MVISGRSVSSTKSLSHHRGVIQVWGEAWIYQLQPWHQLLHDIAWCMNILIYCYNMYEYFKYITIITMGIIMNNNNNNNNSNIYVRHRPKEHPHIRSSEKWIARSLSVIILMQKMRELTAKPLGSHKQMAQGLLTLHDVRRVVQHYVQKMVVWASTPCRCLTNQFQNDRHELWQHIPNQFQSIVSPCFILCRFFL